jgi:aspartate racemase
MTPRHIAIVACWAEGAALCYRTICVERTAILGPHAHPEVTVHTFSLADYMACIYRDDWASVGDLMLASANKLNPHSPHEAAILSALATVLG